MRISAISGNATPMISVEGMEQKENMQNRNGCEQIYVYTYLRAKTNFYICLKIRFR